MLDTILLILVQVWAGIFAFLFLLPFIPGAIDSLVIDPNRYKPTEWPPKSELKKYPMSRRGFFTKLYPGQVKIIETWFGSFIDMLMKWPGKLFHGEPISDCTWDEPKYWGVEDSNGRPDSHPLAAPHLLDWGPLGLPLYPLRVIGWLWTRWVYWLTGAVWVGVPGFRTIRIYWLERYKKIMLPDGNIDLIRWGDWSDHYRVADFQVPVLVPRADTQNMVEVREMLNQICRVFNPYLIAYNSEDDWMTRLIGENTSAAAAFTRTRPHTDLISAKDTTTAQALSEYVTKTVADKVREIGIAPSETQVLDITPTDRNVALNLARPAEAEAEGQARERLAKADAAPVREIGQAIRDFPEAGFIPILEKNAEIAKNAGDKAIIVMSGADPGNVVQLATLRGIRDLNNTGPRAPATPTEPQPPTPPGGNP